MSDHIPWTMNEPHLPYKTGLDVMQSHPLHRTCFGQYQASSAVLEWLGDGDCYCSAVAKLQSYSRSPYQNQVQCYLIDIITCSHGNIIILCYCKLWTLWALHLRSWVVVSLSLWMLSGWERVARVRVCNSVKFETGCNLQPVLKIVTRIVHAA